MIMTHTDILYNDIWLGNMHRFEKERSTWKVTDWKPAEDRLRERPRKRQFEDVEEYLRKTNLGIGGEMLMIGEVEA